MNITELLAQFREESNDIESPYLWPDTVLIPLFNETVDEACIRKDLLFDSTTEAVCEIDVVADTTLYDLHASIVYITKAYLVDSSDILIDVELITRTELDWIKPDWREDTGEPEYLIVDDSKVQTQSVPDEDYTLKLEVYRLPLTSEKMIEVVEPATALSPVIGLAHHRYLHHWALHVAYSKRDIDQYSPDRSRFHLQEFEKYFGKRPDADRRRPQRANLLHTNKLW